MATEVNRLLREMQTGEYIPSENEKQQGIIQPEERPVGEGKNFGPLLDYFINTTPENAEIGEFGFEAAESGYGSSRYDTRFNFDPRSDLEHRRALEQSGFWKIANGAIKGGIYAGTTAVETVAGVINGLLEGGYELGRQIAEGETVGLSKAIGKGVNNFTARSMYDIQRLSDEWFPNYRTTTERTEQYQRDWLKHIFTANFIGDSFLKNFGFTVGAIAGGSIWSKALSAGIRAGVAGNLMKGVTAAAEGSEEASSILRSTLNLVGSGAAETVDAAAVARNINTAAKSLNKMNAMQMLFGSVIGAMGEGTMEGVMAREEFMDDYLSRLNDDYSRARSGLRERLTKELGGTDMVRYVPVRGSDGNITFMAELNEKGEARLAAEERRLSDEYYKKREFANEQGDRLASTTFLLNLPILTASNTIQFGRLFSGGFKTARNTAKVAGGVVNNAGKLVAKYTTAGGSRAMKAIGNALKVGATEANEEMMQGVVSSGSKNVADSRMTSFNDDGYDRDVMGDFSSWLNGMAEGGGDYLKDWKNWQEGFLGMITGLVGMPGRRWSGGIVEAARETRDNARQSEEAVNALNSRVNSKKFQDAWKGYVRHMKYENEMEKAVMSDDQYTWKTANDKQLISDIIMFADAGRLNDLKEIVDVYSNMSLDEAENNGTIEAVTSEANANEVANNPSESLEKIKRQASEIKDNIDLYNNMYESMSAIAPMGVSEDQIKELVSTAMNIKAFERRFLTMFDEVIDGLDKFVKPLSSESKLGKEITDEAGKLQRAKEIYSSLAEIYTGTGIPVDTPLVDAIGTIATLESLHDMIKDSGDVELIKKYDDMIKISNDRKAFLRKMLTLRDLDPVKFEESKETPEKVVEEQKRDRAIEQTNGLRSVSDIKNAYLSRDAKGRAEFINDISAIEDSDQNVKSFLRLKRRHDAFRGYIDKNSYKSDDITVTPPMVNSVINDLLRKAKNEDELINLPDNVFPTFDEFSRDFTGIFGAPSAGTLASVKKIVRDAMASFISSDTATASRNSIKSNIAPPQESSANVSTPTGYDAAQPGSAEPAPTPARLPEWMTQGSTENAAVAEKAPKPTAQQQSEVPQAPVVQAPTGEDLADDAAQAGSDQMPQTVEDEKVHVTGTKDKIAYYRTSVPEIDTGEAKKARRAIRNGDRESLIQADLSDFGPKHPEYAEIWNALAQRDAFNNVATRLEVGDTVEFVVDPTFPMYNGVPQILMTTVKNGERLVLNVLSGQTSQYYALDELRREIGRAYDAFRDEHPNDLFVFSERSRVWAKRAGLIDYDFTGKEEKGITNIPGYNDEAPIVFINRNGDAVLVRGNDQKVLERVSDTFNDKFYNTEHNKIGNLYYLVKSDTDKYIPIRLNIEHFRTSNKDSGFPVFAKIRDILDNIANIVKEANNTNIDGQNTKLRAQLQELGKYLDIHDDFFEIGEYENVGIALRYSSPTNEGALRRPDQMTAEWLTDFVAGLGRSVQLRQDANGKIININEYVNTGIITSNARMLRQKGVDFYVNPWDAQIGEFSPATNTQAEAEKTFTQQAEQASHVAESAEAALNADFGGRDEFDNPEDIESAYGERPVGLRNYERENSVAVSDISNLPKEQAELVTDTLWWMYYNKGISLERFANEKKLSFDATKELRRVIVQADLVIDDPLDWILTQKGMSMIMQRLVHTAYRDLPARTQKAISSKGYTEQEFDGMGDLLKEKVLKCLGV